METILTYLLHALFVILIVTIIITIGRCCRLYCLRQTEVQNKTSSISNNATGNSNMFQSIKKLKTGNNQDLTQDETNVLITMIKARVKSLSMYIHSKNVKIIDTKT